MGVDLAPELADKNKFKEAAVGQLRKDGSYKLEFGGDFNQAGQVLLGVFLPKWLSVSDLDVQPQHGNLNLNCQVGIKKLTMPFELKIDSDAAGKITGFEMTELIPAMKFAIKVLSLNRVDIDRDVTIIKADPNKAIGDKFNEDWKLEEKKAGIRAVRLVIKDSGIEFEMLTEKGLAVEAAEAAAAAQRIAEKQVAEDKVDRDLKVAEDILASTSSKSVFKHSQPASSQPAAPPPPVEQTLPPPQFYPPPPLPTSQTLPPPRSVLELLEEEEAEFPLEITPEHGVLASMVTVGAEKGQLIIQPDQPKLPLTGKSKAITPAESWVASVAEADGGRRIMVELLDRDERPLPYFRIEDLSISMPPATILVPQGEAKVQEIQVALGGQNTKWIGADNHLVEVRVVAGEEVNNNRLEIRIWENGNKDRSNLRYYTLGVLGSRSNGFILSCDTTGDRHQQEKYYQERFADLCEIATVMTRLWLGSPVGERASNPQPALPVSPPRQSAFQKLAKESRVKSTEPKLSIPQRVEAVREKFIHGHEQEWRYFRELIDNKITAIAPLADEVSQNFSIGQLLEKKQAVVFFPGNSDAPGVFLLVSEEEIADLPRNLSGSVAIILSSDGEQFLTRGEMSNATPIKDERKWVASAGRFIQLSAGSTYLNLSTMEVALTREINAKQLKRSCIIASGGSLRKLFDENISSLPPASDFSSKNINSFPILAIEDDTIVVRKQPGPVRISVNGQWDDRGGQTGKELKIGDVITFEYWIPFGVRVVGIAQGNQVELEILAGSQEINEALLSNLYNSRNISQTRQVIEPEFEAPTPPERKKLLSKARIAQVFNFLTESGYHISPSEATLFLSLAVNDSFMDPRLAIFSLAAMTISGGLNTVKGVQEALRAKKENLTKNFWQGFMLGAMFVSTGRLLNLAIDLFSNGDLIRNPIKNFAIRWITNVALPLMVGKAIRGEDGDRAAFQGLKFGVTAFTGMGILVEMLEVEEKLLAIMAEPIRSVPVATEVHHEPTATVTIAATPTPEHPVTPIHTPLPHDTATPPPTVTPEIIATFSPQHDWFDSLGFKIDYHFGTNQPLTSASPGAISDFFHQLVDPAFIQQLQDNARFPEENGCLKIDVDGDKLFDLIISKDREVFQRVGEDIFSKVVTYTGELSGVLYKFNALTGTFVEVDK